MDWLPSDDIGVVDDIANAGDMHHQSSGFILYFHGHTHK